MKLKPGILTGLSLLIAMVLSGELQAQQPTPAHFWLLSSGHDARSISLSTDNYHIGLPACRDMATGPFHEILLVTESGRLLLLDGDHTRPLDGSLPEGSWPEALSGDGKDWLILHRHGAELLRLGRQGEELGRVQLPLGRWRELAVCKSGRIWLAEAGGERFLALGPDGQILLDWFLPRLLPGFSGRLDSWCPDGEGGLILAEAGHVLRLNAAGNLENSWKLMDYVNSLDLVSLGDGRILAVETQEAPRRMVYRRDTGLLLLSSDGRSILSAPDILEPGP